MQATARVELDLPRNVLTPADRLYRVHGAGRETNYFSFDRSLAALPLDGERQAGS